MCNPFEPDRAPEDGPPPPPAPAPRWAIPAAVLCAALCATAATAAAAESPKAPRLKALWSEKVSEPAGAPVLAPSGDHLAVLTWQGDIAVLDARTGRRRWRKQPQVRGGVDRPGLAVDGERVIVTWPGEPAVVAYGLADGRETWRADLSAVPAGLADCRRHRAVVVTHRGMGTLLASAFDPKSGQLLWRSPVPGPVVGAGDAYVFTETPSGFGVWPGRVAAVHCATGEVTPLPTADRALVRFLTAGAGFAVARHLDRGFAREQICLHPLSADGGASVCRPTGDDASAAYPLTGALVAHDTLYFSTAHISAHNLDPSPDSWVFARALTGEPRWRSPPLVSRQAPVDAGAHLWTGFGSTGADDYAFLLDRVDGRPVGRLALRKAPTALAADRERAYVSTYDGRVYAVRLPTPGPTRPARKPLPPQGAQGAAPKVDPGPWRLLGTFDAHPKTARTSGSKRAGAADPVAFVDRAGTLLAVGGNDDKVRVLEVPSGKRWWISKGLGKDVEALAVGGDRIHARIYGGKSYVFEKARDRWRRLRRIKHAHGWMSGLTGDGATLVTDSFDGTVTAWDAASGRERWSKVLRTSFDQRGLRIVGRRVVLHADGELRTLEVGDDAPRVVGTRAVAGKDGGGEMTQAWLFDETRGVWEFCGPGRCVVHVGPLVDPPKDAAPVRLTFDTRGAGWVPSVPSTVQISPDGRWLFFFRLGLEPLLVEVATDRRVPVAQITEQPLGEYISARFSADGRRLALGMHPRSWQVTVIGQE